MIEVHNLTFGYSSKDEANILRGGWILLLRQAN